MREAEQGFSQGSEIAGSAGQSDDFVDGGPGFAEFGQQAFEAQRGELSFQGMGRKNQIPFGTTHSPENAAQPWEVGQFQINHVGEGKKGQEKKNPLAGPPVESASFFPGAEGEKDGNLLLRHGLKDGFRFHPFRKKKVQANFSKINAGWGI